MPVPIRCGMGGRLQVSKYVRNTVEPSTSHRSSGWEGPAALNTKKCSQNAPLPTHAGGGKRCVLTEFLCRCQTCPCPPVQKLTKATSHPLLLCMPTHRWVCIYTCVLRHSWVSPCVSKHTSEHRHPTYKIERLVLTSLVFRVLRSWLICLRRRRSLLLMTCTFSLASMLSSP